MTRMMKSKGKKETGFDSSIADGCQEHSKQRVQSEHEGIVRLGWIAHDDSPESIANSTVVIPMRGGIQSCETMAGTFQVKEFVKMRECMLPEFDKTKRIQGQEAMVFDAQCNYEVILGRDFLREVGIKMDFETGKVTWLDRTIDMKPRASWEQKNSFVFAGDTVEQEKRKKTSSPKRWRTTS